MAKRQNTRLEAEGAEFLVLGILLTEGIEAHKTYTRFPGYDVIAVSGRASRSCRIQVKSRWATDYDGSFQVQNWDCDFFVFVELNRGYRGWNKKPTDDDPGRQPPRFFVVPRDIAETESRAKGKDRTAVYARKLENSEAYLDNWDQIRSFLGEGATL